MLNLDYLCMEYGQKIAKINDSNLEKNLRKALGVLQEDGVYAMFLWIEKNLDKVRKGLVDLLNEPEIKRYLLIDSEAFSKDDFTAFCKNLIEAAKDIDKLLFMKKILERTLTYALYHTKIGEKDV